MEEALLGLAKEAGEYVINSIIDHLPQEANKGILANQPRNVIPNEVIRPTTPTNPLQRSVVPMLPINPQITPIKEIGFDKNNYDFSFPSYVIYDDGRNHTAQPHPSSTYMGNAAFPNSAQGFRRF